MSTGEQPARAIPVVGRRAPQVRLVVQSGSDAHSSIKCRHVVTLIGSREGCKVTLRHRSVSSTHVALINTGTHIVAVDLVTSTGTMLNGLKMSYERLTDGDLLKVGRWTFRVDIEHRSKSGQSDAHQFELDPKPKVVALEHVRTSRILQPARDVCTIGRRNGCDITVPDGLVSRVHCLLLTCFTAPAICDLLSENETLVNGEPIVYQKLKNDDIVTVGESEFRLRVVGSSVVERAVKKKSNNGKLAAGLEPPKPDMIDIEAVEGAQRWRIADQSKKASQKR